MLSFRGLGSLLALSVCITLPLITHAESVTVKDNVTPPFLKNVPAVAISRFDLQKVSSRSSDPNSDVAIALLSDDKDTAGLQLSLPQAEGMFDVQVKHSVRHTNGDVTVYGIVWLNEKPQQVLLTQGKAGAIGEINGAAGRSLIIQQRDQVYLVNLSKAGLTEASYENDVVKPAQNIAALTTTQVNATTIQQHDGKSFTIVDIMMLYASEVAEQYPDGLADTLMNQLVAKANQAFVDSDIDVQLRLVHRQFVNYTQPSNFTALDDLRFALEGNGVTQADDSLSNVAVWREQYGADVVAMIRTHDLNERRVCGIAYFPQSVPDTVINISNVGISGGSNCIDTFTHEVGHNFGAGHQFQNGQSVGALPSAGALLVPGKFNTIMSSIGTGDANRSYKLNRFSNPQLNCAATVCGDTEQADNAAAVNFFAAYNSGLRSAVSTVQITPPPPGDPDSDADGTTDLYDAFPFDATEINDTDNDGVGDNTDIFPNDPSEWTDFDQDGLGDNVDPDDDNDGVSDTLDALPFDPTESADSDGDGVGNNRDKLPSNFQDFNDTDGDGTGNRFDYDNDNDGVDDFDRRPDGKQQLIVVNAGNGKIQAFNLPDGDFVETLHQTQGGGLSFRSDIVDLGAGQLGFVQFSDVLRLDRHSKAVDTLISRFLLSSNFAAHLLKTGESQTESRLYVSNGLAPSHVDVFQFSNSSMSTVAVLSDNNSIYRDTFALSASHNLLVQRDSNQLLRYPVAVVSPQLMVWAQGTGLDKPEHLARLADGSILVTNAGSRNVTRFSNSGEYSGVFISAGSGGLGMPGCIAMDNVGDVYLCSTDTNQVLKYSGNNGAPIGVIASVESDGMDEPVAIAITGQALDLAPFDPTNDTDGDGVANNLDAFPIDPDRSAGVVQPPPVIDDPKSGGSMSYLLSVLLLLCWQRRYCRQDSNQTV